MKFIEISGFRGARVNKITAKAKSQQISPKKIAGSAFGGEILIFYDCSHTKLRHRHNRGSGRHFFKASNIGNTKKEGIEWKDDLGNIETVKTTNMINVSVITRSIIYDENGLTIPKTTIIKKYFFPFLLHPLVIPQSI